jgi:hypothetical protein
MKVIFKTNLFYSYNFYICKLNHLKVIDDLYSQCLTQTLSKTTSKSYTEGVYMYWGSPISPFVIIGGFATAVPQYISLNTNIEGGSHRSVRENIAEKW